jgi:cyanophycin synthetase
VPTFQRTILTHGGAGSGFASNAHNGMALALVYDYILLTDFDPRNRPIGETSDLVYKGLIQGGFKKENIEIVQKPDKAVDTIFSRAQQGDLLVIQPDELEPVMSQILERYRKIVTGI